MITSAVCIFYHFVARKLLFPSTDSLFFTTPGIISRKSGYPFYMNTINCLISSVDPHADKIISDTLIKSILSLHRPFSKLVFFCVGTPLVTGDTLGPYIGTVLKKLCLPSAVIYGTQEEPVHALNLTKQWFAAKKKHPGSCFIAIDASFGPQNILGNICVENRPLYPGQGVGKTLPPVGDISITGVVCPNCRKQYRQLEAIPFSYIHALSDPIIHGIFQTLLYFFTSDILLHSDIHRLHPDHIFPTILQPDQIHQRHHSRQSSLPM